MNMRSLQTHLHAMAGIIRRTQVSVGCQISMPVHDVRKQAQTIEIARAELYVFRQRDPDFGMHVCRLKLLEKMLVFRTRDP